MKEPLMKKHFINEHIINERISFLPATENPLSSDVGIIRGDSFTWVFDVGNNDASYEYLSELGPEKAILSHFHPDHMGNVSRLSIPELYVGKNTYNYTKEGIIVEEDLYLTDGCSLHLFPVPSSHAKGCLGLEVDETYAFLGDAIYANIKKGTYGYNTQHLTMLIKRLKELKAPYVLLSHKRGMVREKKAVLYTLEKIYASRDKDASLIPYLQTSSELC